MNKIDKKLSELKETKRIGLMTHVVVGYPTLAKTVSIIKAMEKAGADLVELQIPFSDPLADGPTIMKACEEALLNGTKVKDAFDVVKELSKKITIPMLFMAYYNTVFHYGVDKFCKDARGAGIAGLIVPDMPIEEEENEGFYAACEKNNLYAIHVISPATTDERLRKNAAVAKGFIYCTARQGITGSRDTLDSNLAAYLKKVRKHFSIPLAVGFGISKRAHVEALRNSVDIAVVGSALIDIINKKGNTEQQVGEFVSTLVVH